MKGVRDTIVPRGNSVHSELDRMKTAESIPGKLGVTTIRGAVGSPSP